MAAPFAVAHRGLSAEFPENTMAAFVGAAEAGFTAIELDVRATKDAHPVVVHDATLERVAGHDHAVEDLVLADLRDLPLAGAVPELGQVLGAFEPSKMCWDIEIKEQAAVEPTLQAIKDAKLGGNGIVTTIDPLVLAALHDHNNLPGIGFIPLGQADEDDIALAVEMECSWIMMDGTWTKKKQIAQAHDAGLKVGVWTVNEVAKANWFAAHGVDAVITDVRAVQQSLPGPSSW